MSKIKLILKLLIVVLILLAGIAFLYRNPALITVDFFAYKFSEVPAGIAILLSFVLGGLIGVLVRLPGGIWKSSQLKRKQRKLEKTEQALALLKNESAKAG